MAWATSRSLKEEAAGPLPFALAGHYRKKKVPAPENLLDNVSSERLQVDWTQPAPLGSLQKSVILSAGQSESH